VLMLTSKGSAGVAGAGFVTLAATLSTMHQIPAAGLVLLLGVEQFTNAARAVTNIIATELQPSWSPVGTCLRRSARDAHPQWRCAVSERDIRIYFVLCSPPPPAIPLGCGWCVSGLLVAATGIILIIDMLGASGLESIGCAGCGWPNIHCVDVAAKNTGHKCYG